MPSVPIEMPSEMVMVLKITGLAAGVVDARPRLRAASLSMCMLHGVTMAPGGGDADLRLA